MIKHKQQKSIIIKLYHKIFEYKYKINYIILHLLLLFLNPPYILYYLYRKYIVKIYFIHQRVNIKIKIIIIVTHGDLKT